jgi:predicted Abi (CAAX) family protease
LPEANTRPAIEKRLRWAGLLISVGLTTQLITFIWIHPLAFMAFAGISCPLVVAGILLFLYSLVAVAPHAEYASRGKIKS